MNTTPHVWGRDSAPFQKVSNFWGISGHFPLSFFRLRSDNQEIPAGMQVLDRFHSGFRDEKRSRFYEEFCIDLACVWRPVVLSLKKSGRRSPLNLSWESMLSWLHHLHMCGCVTIRQRFSIYKWLRSLWKARRRYIQTLEFILDQAGCLPTWPTNNEKNNSFDPQVNPRKKNTENIFSQNYHVGNFGGITWHMLVCINIINNKKILS